MSANTPDVKRPWGGYTILKKTNSHWIKKLFVNKNARLSLQSHALRDEIWLVLSGKIIAQIGRKKIMVKQGGFVFIPKKQKHRMRGKTDACVFEVAYGTVLEHDIVRYEDDYGRV